MANEGKDDYRPDPKKIELFEREAKRELARKKLNKAIKKAQEKDNKQKQKEKDNGNGNGKADYTTFISFEQWQTKLVEKYNQLYNTVKENMPPLWLSLEFDLSVFNMLHIKDITQPFAGIVLGPPSSLKTVGLEMFRKSKDTHYTDDFSPRSFVSHNSGLTEERLQQIDLIPKIRNKCFLTPELAPTFSAKDEDLTRLLGILTRVLDGYGYENDTGAQGHRGYNDRMMFTWLGAAVDIPFKVHKLMTALGPRLYFIRIPSIENKTNDDYINQLEHGDFDIKRSKVQQAVDNYQEWLGSACPNMVHDDMFNSDLKKITWINGNAKDYDSSYGQLQKDAYGHIVKLGKLLAHLRGVVPTWHTHDTQGLEYGYTLPTIEEPDRAMQQLANLAKGHALLTGRNYITPKDDLPLIIKVVLSTAPIERVTIFDILLAHKGVLNVKEIIQSLRVSQHTAQKTMLELDILGLVDKSDDMDIIGNDGIVRQGSQIKLKDEFKWFLSEEFTSLRQGFKPLQDEAIAEKYPPHREADLSSDYHQGNGNGKVHDNGNGNDNALDKNDVKDGPQRGGEISAIASDSEETKPKEQGDYMTKGNWRKYLDES